MTRKYKERELVWAILRYDDYGLPDLDWEARITVKEVVRDEEIAQHEVARLNELNKDKGCHYWATSTRLFPPGRSASEESDTA